MQSNFLAGLELVLGHEGGYVDDPRDSGGRTNMGVTQKVYEDWLGREVTEQEMRDMKREDVEKIYKENYWDRVKGDDLPSGLDIAVFDMAINAGTGRSAKILQKVVGAVEDGAIGEKTIEAVKKSKIPDVLNTIIKDREDFYKKLSNFDRFGKGWLRRTEETHEFAKEMLDT